MKLFAAYIETRHGDTVLVVETNKLLLLQEALDYVAPLHLLDAGDIRLLLAAGVEEDAQNLLRSSMSYDGHNLQVFEVELSELDEVIRNLRKALLDYARPKDGWTSASHADAYEASKELVPLDESESEH